MPEKVEQQAHPEQRQRDAVGKEWVSRSMNASAIIDHVKQQRTEGGHTETEAPGDESAEHAGEDFDDRVTRRECARLHAAHLPAQHEPAHTAVCSRSAVIRCPQAGTRGARRDDVELRSVGDGFLPRSSAHWACHSRSIIFGRR